MIKGFVIDERISLDVAKIIIEKYKKKGMFNYETCSWNTSYCCYNSYSKLFIISKNPYLGGILL